MCINTIKFPKLLIDRWFIRQLFSMWSTEVGIFKNKTRKLEKKERKHALDKESDQENYQEKK